MSVLVNVAIVLTVVFAFSMQTHHLWSQGEDTPLKVSMRRLLDYPEEYDGKRIATIGFLQLQFEGNALFLTEDDQVKRNYKNGIAIESASRPKMSLNLRYVRVEGTFYAKAYGHRGRWSGEIKNISKATESQTPE